MVVTGYKRALDLAISRLDAMAPEVVVENTGVAWNGSGYEVPWFGQLTPLERGGVEERIIWAHYMLGRGPRAPRNRYIAYKQVPGAAIYNDNFIKRCVNPLVKAFHNDLTHFAAAGAALGGRRVELGHMALTIDALPFIPITLILWRGDDEIPASGNILFDEGAIEWLCPEDLVALAGMVVYKMVRVGASNKAEAPDENGKA